MSETNVPLTSQYLSEQAELLGKVQELRDRWDAANLDPTADSAGLARLAGEYVKAVDKVYEKFTENVEKIASAQPKV